MSKLWDDLKHNMKEWSSAAVEKAEEVSKVAVAKTEELTKISKIKLEVHQLQRDIRKARQALGKLAYDHAKDANMVNFTGNTELVALRHGYSGRSMLAQSLTAHAPWRALPSQIGSIKHALAPYCYRCPINLSYPDCGIACANDVEELIKTTTTGKVAGILLEPILGIGDPRYDHRIDFIAGFHGLKSIEEKVNSGKASVGFSLFATQMEDVISFADKKLTMPPKSTWFDPKPLDGLVAYDFE